MKKTIKVVLLTILAVFLIAVIAFAIWQRDNIGVLWRTLTSDSETISHNLDQVFAEHKKQLENDYQVFVPQPSREQIDALLSGAKTRWQIIEALGLDKITSSNPKDANGIIEKYTAKLYAYRLELMTQLAGIKQEYLDQWTALSDEEKTSERKTALINEGVHRCYTLEKESDEHVQQVLRQLEQELKAIGAETSVTKVLWNQYASEKAAEKTYYLKNYLW